MSSPYLPSSEGEGRLLILIDNFTTPTKNLEGRTKLAKLDFFLRYPDYLRRALEIRGADDEVPAGDASPLEQRMVRYRYGPWDPAYFALLGSLIGRKLVVPVAEGKGVGYRSTALGRTVARELAAHYAWEDIAKRAKLLRRYLDLSGTNLKNLIYEHFPEVTAARWGKEL
jgi:hypothetical protein